MTRARILSRSAAVALALVLSIAIPAQGVERSSAEFLDLASEARTDPSAIPALLETTSIDGTPVDADRLLGDHETLHARLDTVLDQREVDVDTGASTLAESILVEERFDTAGGVAAGAVIQAWLLRLVSGILAAIEESIPGGLGTVGWVLLVGAVVGMGVVARSLLRRRERSIEEQEAAASSEARRRPAALERRASEAEGGGRYEEALRLRFQAALLRLDAHGAIRFHDGITSGQVVERVAHGLLPGLVGTHDEVVYGGRTATIEDVRASKTQWPRVINEVTP